VRTPARSRRPVRQSIFTVICRADPLRISELEARLEDVDAVLRGESTNEFEAVEMLHFFSFTVFADRQFGPYLVFESNVDGRPGAYLDRMCRVAAATLHAIYRFCPDYESTTADAAYLCRYLRRHIVRADTAFIGNVGRSALRIRDEASLVAQIHDFIDGFSAAEGTPPETVVAAVRAFVRSEEKWSWVWTVQPRLSVFDRAARWAALGGFAAVLLALLPFSQIPLGAFLIALRSREVTDPVVIPGPPAEQLRNLTHREDRIVQNHMASLCYVKPGAFRKWTLKFVLFGANLVARVSTNGRLLGLDSLHFAHWALIDNDMRMLFLTNYDGSWENYLDDFIDKASCGLTAIWSNTFNFPRTRFLFFDGAQDERNFKAISRTTQFTTNVWYSAYPGLTVAGIENNTAICEGLRRPSEAFDAAAWLRRF
jgi:hypothetical protein